MKLSIDNTTSSVIRLWLDTDSKEIPYVSPRDQDLLKDINLFLQEKGKKLQDLTEIHVATGPGGFTSLRTSIAIAQALAFGLQIPINGQPPGTSIEALYGQEPNISKPSNK
ncbi:MAG: hypothetical protein ABI425_01760 [Patescibacteria group bacterium]